MSLDKFLFVAGSICFLAPVVYGEVHCPGNAAGLPLRLVQNTLFVASVQVNGTGPYDFLIDTGAQVNTIDESLASDLDLVSEKVVGVSGAATYSRNPLVGAELAAGGRDVPDAKTIVASAGQLRGIDPKIRGILGGTFLQHFDFLLDNQSRILCLDDTGILAAAIKGKRVALENPLSLQERVVPFTRPLVVSARISGIGQPRILMLDSGSNSPLLFPQSAPTQWQPQRTLRRSVNGAGQDFGIMPPQEVRIGKTVLRGAEFAVPLNSIGGHGAPLQEDGIMPTFAYRRVFISPSKGYAVLETWE